MLMSSHILSELSNLATDYGFLEKGRLLEQVSAEEIRSRCRDCLELWVDDAAKAMTVLAIRCSYAAGFHLLLGAFNLLPLPALDGGQLLELLAERRLSLRAADRLCFLVGLLTLMPLLSGGWLLFRRTGNFTLLLTLFTLLTAAFPGKN